MAELPKDTIFHYHSDDGITIKVDAIPLVRCGECKWFLNTGYGKNRKCYRPNHGGNGGLRMNESDYCSYGEKEVQE